MPRILVRYANRLLLVNATLTGGVLGSIFLAKYLLNYLIKASTGKLPADLVLSMAALVFVSSMQYLLPLTAFFALVVTLLRLREAQELTVMAALGLDPGRILALFWPTLLGAVVVLGLMVSWVMPWAERQQRQLLVEAGRDPAAQWLQPGRFAPLPDGGVVYVGQGDGNGVFADVFVRREAGEGTEVAVAPTARLTNDGGHLRLLLQQGVLYRDLEGAHPLVYQFAEGRLDTMLALPGEVGEVGPRALPLPALLASHDRAFVAELHWRAAIVIMLLSLAWSTRLLAWPRGREGDRFSLFLLVGVYALYFNALTVLVSWYRKGLLDTPWPIQASHLLPLLIVGSVLWWRKRRYAAAG